MTATRKDLVTMIHKAGWSDTPELSISDLLIIAQNTIALATSRIQHERIIDAVLAGNEPSISDTNLVAKLDKMNKDLSKSIA